MNRSQKYELIQALEACLYLQNRHNRDTIVDDLPFKANVRRDEAMRADITHLVTACLHYPNGLDELLACLQFYEGDSLPMRKVAALIHSVTEKADIAPPSSHEATIAAKASTKIVTEKVEVVAPTPQPIIETPTIKPPPVPATPKTKITFDWVTIPAGEFIMGSNDGSGHEKPQHKVYLPEYQIARVPVTNEQWGLFLQDSGYQWASRDKLWKDGLPRGKEQHPVVYVSWHDSLAFCQWAGVQLPTEAAWEKAARGTDERKYPWGKQTPTLELANYGFNVGDTMPVGKYPQGASPYGCLDMAGNVWEWCSSVYYRYPYKADDGRGDITISNNRKMLRGGSWYDETDDLRCAYRNDNFPSNNFSNVGVRCFVVPIF